MSFTPLFDAGWLIASHAIAALLAFVLGTIQLLAPKGTFPHKSFGYLWCALMLWVACVSLFIHEAKVWGPFSPIHILSVITLMGVIGGIFEARRKTIKAHRNTMIILYSGGLVIAGLFTFLPGRIMHDVVFGG